MSNQTISEAQRKLNEELHEARPDFGSRGGAGNVGLAQVIGRYKDIGVINSVLDYGTGKGAFPKSLKRTFPELEVGAYDPAVKKYNKQIVAVCNMRFTCVWSTWCSYTGPVYTIC